MHFYGTLILFVTVSAACGLTCYQCVGKGCNATLTCPPGSDRCASFNFFGFVVKNCTMSSECVEVFDLVKCCSTDLCNGATPAASSILLLTASSAIVTLFL